MKETTGCNRHRSMAPRSSLIWRPTQEQNKEKKEQKLDQIFVNKMFVEQSSVAATDLGMRMSMDRESRIRTKNMPSDSNKENMEEALDEQTSLKETHVEPIGMVATDLQRRMSSVGESRRRTKRMSLDTFVNTWSPEDASCLENCFDVSSTLHKLSLVSQRYLLDNDEHWRSNPLFPGSLSHLQWNQSIWEGEEDAGSAAEVPRSPSPYVKQVVEIGYSPKDLLLHENSTASNNLMHSTCGSSPQRVPLEPIMHKDDIFPGNTKYLSPLRVRKLASESCDYGPRNHVKLGSLADSESPLKVQKTFQVIGGSFSRLDTRSIKKNYPNAVLETRCCSSKIPKNSALGNCRGGLCTTWNFWKLLQRGSQIGSSEELSNQEMKGSSWEAHRDQRTCKQVSTTNSVVVWEKRCLPKGFGVIQVLKNARKFNK